MHLEWERMLFDATGGRWCRGPRSTAGADASLWEWLIFEEEYYRAGAPAARHAERHLPARADDLRVRHAGAAGPHPPAHGRGRRPVVPGMVASRTRAATSPASRAGRRATRSTAAGVLDGQKTWTTRGAFCTHLFGLFRSDPDGRAPPRPHLLPRAARRRGRDRARLRPARRRRGLRRGVLRRRLRPRRPTCSASVDQGWSVAMATTSPSAASRCARPAASSPPPNGSSSSVPRRRRRRPVAQPVLRDRVVGVDGGRGVPIADAADRDRHRRRPAGGRGVEHGQDLVERARRRAARDRARPARRARPNSTTRGRRASSSRCPGPIYAGTNEIQRNIAAERVLGLPRA